MNTEITEYSGAIRNAGTNVSTAVRVSCLLLLAFAGFACSIQPQMPPWAFMWTVALVLFAGCKWLTWWRACRLFESRNHDEKAQAAPNWIRAGYLLAWVGMDAQAFLRTMRPIAKP